MAKGNTTKGWHDGSSGEGVCCRDHIICLWYNIFIHKFFVFRTKKKWAHRWIRCSPAPYLNFIMLSFWAVWGVYRVQVSMCNAVVWRPSCLLQTSRLWKEVGLFSGSYIVFIERPKWLVRGGLVKEALL